MTNWSELRQAIVAGNRVEAKRLTEATGQESVAPREILTLPFEGRWTGAGSRK